MDELQSPGGSRITRTTSAASLNATPTKGSPFFVSDKPKIPAWVIPPSRAASTPPTSFQSNTTVFDPSTNFTAAAFLTGGRSSRIMMALTSGLPNEIQWALLNLVVHSYTWHDFVLQATPGLLECLLQHAQPLSMINSIEPDNTSISDTLLRYSKVRKNLTETDHVVGNVADINLCVPGISYSDLFDFCGGQVTMNEAARVMSVMQILSNASFFATNAILFSGHSEFRRFLLRCLTLDNRSAHIDIRKDAMATFVNIAPHLILMQNEDPFMQVVCNLLLDDDRSLVLDALRILTIWCAKLENDNVMKEIDVSVLLRVTNLLLLDDDTLLHAALEFLSHFTALGSEACIRLLRTPGNIVQLLIFYFGGRQAVRRNLKRPYEHLPQVPIGKYEDLQSFKVARTLTPTTAVTTDSVDQQKAANQQDEANHERSQSETLPNQLTIESDATQTPTAEKESTSSIPAATTTANDLNSEQKVDQLQPAQQEQQTEMEVAPANKVAEQQPNQDLPLPDVPTTTTEDYACHWVDCLRTFVSYEEMLAHVSQTHIQESNGLSCLWKSCGRSVPHRRALLGHVLTHFKPKQDSNGSASNTNSTHLSAEQREQLQKLADPWWTEFCEDAAYALEQPTQMQSPQAFLAAMVLMRVVAVPENRSVLASFVGDLVLLSARKSRVGHYASLILNEFDNNETQTPLSFF